MKEQRTRRRVFSLSANTAAAATPAKPNPWYPDHAVISATKYQLKAMPQFKYAI